MGPPYSCIHLWIENIFLNVTYCWCVLYVKVRMAMSVLNTCRLLFLSLFLKQYSIKILERKTPNPISSSPSLQSTGIVLGLVSNLEMIWTIREDGRAQVICKCFSTYLHVWLLVLWGVGVGPETNPPTPQYRRWLCWYFTLLKEPIYFPGLKYEVELS